MLHKHRSLEPTSHITEIYVTEILYTLGVGMIGIFIPIYLLNLGYSLSQAFLYLIVMKLVSLLVSPFAAWLSYRIGLKRTTLVRIPFFVSGFLTLYALTSTDIHFLVPAALNGFAMTLYWIPLLTLFSHYSHRERRGSEVGRMHTMQSLALVIGPALGGFIAAALGFPILLLIALCVVALSTIPLFLSPEIRAHRFSFNDFWDMRHHSFVAVALTEGFSYVVTLYLFPLLIFLTLGSTESVGLIESLGALVFAGATLFIGRIVDGHDRGFWLKLGAVLLALTVIPRPFLSTHLQFGIIIILGAVAASIYKTSYMTRMFDEASELGERADEFIVVWDIFLNLGRIILLSLVLLLPWEWGFYIAGAVLILTSIAVRKPQVA